jgi:hypothetical protein
MRKSLCAIVFAVLNASVASGAGFDGLNMSLGTLSQMSDAQSRSISPESLTGEKGKAGMAKLGEGAASRAAGELGQGWKVSPYIDIVPGQTLVLADIKGPGAINHIWMTPTGNNRLTILRMYWDGEKTPSVEVPTGDFFAKGFKEFMTFTSLAVCVNPGSGFNSYWSMPFRTGAKLTMTNTDTKPMRIYYQIDYTLTAVPQDAAYFHTQFRTVNPVKYKEVYTILDGVQGRGQYVGTYMRWHSKRAGWWGEGEIKFFMDGDKEFPTIAGTGTEDYFCGSYCFRVPNSGSQDWTKGPVAVYSTPYAGLNQVIYPADKADVEVADAKYGMYRWHITDPIRFEKDLKVTIQDLGWKENEIYLALQDNIASTAYWYQTEPHAAFPTLPEGEQPIDK